MCRELPGNGLGLNGDREWDVERTLEATASALILLSLGLGATVDR
ncbi:hypothetical protein [Halosolutus halophilus]|nr:hypothetical protein [Halosolutus halophilus]